MSLITLTTDFGSKDPFIGMMKGVIYSINPDLHIVDLSHGIDSQDILEGAFIIRSAYGFFPRGTIHIVVIDPGVGSTRRPILVSSGGQYFIGPDNGVLSWIISGDTDAEVIEITEEKYFLGGASSTFHGRDIFAPVAAWLSKGVAPHSLGSVIRDYTSLDIPDIEKGKELIRGRIIYIDKFGNITTNIPARNLKGRESVRLCGKEIPGISKYYAEKKPGELGAIINSFGLLEVYAYMDNAARILKSSKGDLAEIIFSKRP